MTKNIDDMTGEELRKEFFTKHLGWEWKRTVKDGSTVEQGTPLGGWFDKDGKAVNWIFPFIDTDLNAFEEWVWPELEKICTGEAYCQKDSATQEWDFYFPTIKEFNNGLENPWNSMNKGQDSTKALAQLKAAMKALSKT